MPNCPFCAKPVPDASSVCPHCLRAQPVVVKPVRANNSQVLTVMHGRWRLAVLATGLVVACAYGVKNIDRVRESSRILRGTQVADAPVPEGYTPAPELQSVQTTVVPPIELHIADTASVKIDANRYLAFAFTGDGRSGCRVRGNVHVISGGDRTVNVFVVDRDGVADLEAGRTPRTYYESGSLSDVALDFNVDGRSAYTLVVSNLGTKSRANVVRLKNIVGACSD